MNVIVFVLLKYSTAVLLHSFTAERFCEHIFNFACDLFCRSYQIPIYNPCCKLIFIFIENRIDLIKMCQVWRVCVLYSTCFELDIIWINLPFRFVFALQEWLQLKCVFWQCILMNEHSRFWKHSRVFCKNEARISYIGLKCVFKI